MNRQRMHVPSPLGWIEIRGDRRRVIGVKLCSFPEARLILKGPPVLSRCARQIRAYFQGRRAEFDVPLCMKGTSFQKRVWVSLRKIRFGQTASYAQVANRLGAPKASRAVGAAVKANPFFVIVPCHRVVGKNRTLTGYAYGLRIKQWLLEHEAAP